MKFSKLEVLELTSANDEEVIAVFTDVDVTFNSRDEPREEIVVARRRGEVVATAENYRDDLVIHRDHLVLGSLVLRNPHTTEDGYGSWRLAMALDERDAALLELAHAIFADDSEVFILVKRAGEDGGKVSRITIDGSLWGHDELVEKLLKGGPV